MHEDRRDKFIGIRTTGSVMSRLESLCSKLDRQKSTVVRDAIALYLRVNDDSSMQSRLSFESQQAGSL